MEPLPKLKARVIYDLAVREAYQSRIDQWILNNNIHVHLNPNFRESGLRAVHTQFG